MDARCKAARVTAVAELLALYRQRLFAALADMPPDLREQTVPSLGRGAITADELRALLNQPQLRLQLMQFASGPCGDPICLDASTTSTDDLAVVVLRNVDLSPSS
jgi:hypothetical protein